MSKLFLPEPGEGPSAEDRANGCFELTLFGRPKGTTPYTHKVTVSADSDPGYSATAKMIGESALCAAATDHEHGGIHTPASAFGHALIERLNTVGIRFKSEAASR